MARNALNVGIEYCRSLQTWAYHHLSGPATRSPAYHGRGSTVNNALTYFVILRTRPAHEISPVIAIKGRTFTPAATVRASTTVLTWHCPLSPAVIPVWGSPYLETPLAASAQVISGQCACILALDLWIGRSTASTSRFRPDVSRPPVSSPGPFRNRQLHIYDGW